MSKSKLLTFSLPPVLNEQINANRSNKHIGAGQKKDWTGRIKQAALNQNPERCHFQKVWVALEFVVRTHAYDPDGLDATMKFVYDGLAAAGVIPRDNINVIQSPSLHFRSVDHTLERSEQFLNVLLMDRPRIDLSFAHLAKSAGVVDDDSEDEDID